MVPPSLYAIGGLVVVILGLSVTIYWQSRNNEILEANNSKLEYAVEQQNQNIDKLQQNHLQQNRATKELYKNIADAEKQDDVQILNHDEFNTFLNNIFADLHAISLRNTPRGEGGGSEAELPDTR